MSPRVCLLTETFFPILGGGENQARLLASQLLARGLPVFVLTRRSRPDLAREASIDGVRVRRVGPAGFARYGKYLMLPLVFLALVRERSRYDVLYVCGYRILGLAAVIAGKLLGKPVVLKADSEGELSGAFVWMDARIARHRALAWVAGRLLAVRNALLRRADLFISISDGIAQELRRHGVPPQAIRSIPNGIDTSRFHPVTAQEKRELRRHLGLPDNGVVVAYSGKLNRRKGLERLLRVWTSVAARYPEALLLLIGSGEGQCSSCEPALRAFVRKQGLAERVRFTGFVEDVPRYLQASDVYVFPSEGEGFPLAPLEALACALPVISTRVGGLGEVIAHGTSGLLVEPGLEEPLRAALCELIEQHERRMRLGTRGREAVRRYDIAHVAEDYAAVFQGLHRLQSNPTAAVSGVSG